MTTKCRHCKDRAGQAKKRWLCFRCFNSPARELYPLPPGREVYTVRGHGAVGHGESPLPKEPTTALPGSEEKIAVMMERAKRRENLHHPLDARAGHSTEDD